MDKNTLKELDYTQQCVRILGKRPLAGHEMLRILKINRMDLMVFFIKMKSDLKINLPVSRNGLNYMLAKKPVPPNVLHYLWNNLGDFVFYNSLIAIRGNDFLT